MHTVITFAVLGLGIGGVYGLLGNGLVLIYRGSGLVNFAHGAMAMAAAYTFYELDRVQGWNVELAFVASVALLAIIGVLTQVILMRRLRDSAPISRLIGTLGVLALLDGLFSNRFGASTNTGGPTDLRLPHGPLHIGSYTIDKQSLCLLGIGALICLALYCWTKYSARGLAITAVAESPEAAATLGWSPQGLATLTWGTGAALAGIAGILIAPTTGLVVTNMTLIVVSAMAAALLGGFESFPIVFGAGVVIGVAQSEMARYVTAPGWSDSLPFLVITVALVVRGRGLPVRGHVLDQLPRLASGVVPLRVILPLTVLLCVGTETVFSQNLTLALTVQVTVAIILLSIVVVTGYAGQLSLAQFALAGMGAYVAGRLSAAQGWPFILCLIAGVLGAAGAGAVIGAPALRTRGVNLAIITLGLAVAVEDLIFLNPNYTGGFGGTTVASPKLFGLSIDPIETPGRYAIFCCLCLLAVTVVVGNVRRSRVGRRMIAVRANERAAASLGVSVTGAKLYAFSLAAGVAGLGGVLLAFSESGVAVQHVRSADIRELRWLRDDRRHRAPRRTAVWLGLPEWWARVPGPEQVRKPRRMAPSARSEGVALILVLIQNPDRRDRGHAGAEVVQAADPPPQAVARGARRIRAGRRGRLGSIRRLSRGDGQEGEERTVFRRTRACVAEGSSQDHRPHRQVRRRGGCRLREPRGGAWRNRRPHRPERSGKDHLHRRGHGIRCAPGRRHLSRRSRCQSCTSIQAGASGDRADVPVARAI